MDNQETNKTQHNSEEDFLDNVDEEEEIKPLKPVTLSTPKRLVDEGEGPDETWAQKKYTDSDAKQARLLKAMQITDDPKKLRDMIGVRTVAEVYQTLDRMAARKEFHAALDRQGITFDFIVGGIQQIAAGAEKDSDRLNALKMLLQTLGLDKYPETDGLAKGSWEDRLLRVLEEEKEQQRLQGKKRDLPIGTDPNIEEYEVVEPEMPDRIKQKRKKEEEIAETLYKKDD